MVQHHTSGNMRGAVPGSWHSAEDDTRTETVASQTVQYECTRGDSFTITFAADAEYPDDWSCKCGEPAQAVVEGQAAPKARPSLAKTHLEYLRERRDTAQLEELLAERLSLLYAERGLVYSAPVPVQEARTPTTPQRKCELCGGAIRADNELGICTKNAACKKESDRRHSYRAWQQRRQQSYQHRPGPRPARAVH